MKVMHYMDNEYIVTELNDDGYPGDTLFKGSLADCEAFIRLNQDGYML